jgi:hypothetical protein
MRVTSFWLSFLCSVPALQKNILSWHVTEMKWICAVLCNRIFQDWLLRLYFTRKIIQTFQFLIVFMYSAALIKVRTGPNLPSGSIKGGKFIDQLASHEEPCSMEFDRNVLCILNIYSSECLFMCRMIQLPTMRPILVIFCHWRWLTSRSFLILSNTPVVRNSGVGTDLAQLSMPSTFLWLFFIKKPLYCYD